MIESFHSLNSCLPQYILQKRSEIVVSFMFIIKWTNSKYIYLVNT